MRAKRAPNGQVITLEREHEIQEVLGRRVIPRRADGKADGDGCRTDPELPNHTRWQAVGPRSVSVPDVCNSIWSNVTQNRRRKHTAGESDM